MEIEVVALGEECTLVRLAGRLDSQGVDRIETRFSAAVVAAGRNAVVDMAGVSFMASLGIRMLIANARALAGKGRKLALFAVAQPVMDVLESVAIDQIVPIAST